MIQILDTTLREGEQTPGIYFDEHIKLAIARLLDEIGVDIIEAGHPSVSNEICSAVKQIAKVDLRATLGAHSRSLKEDIDIALECNVGFLGLFYCVSNERLNDVFEENLSFAIKNISKMISYAKKHKPDLIVRYTPEDTVRSNYQNVLDASVAAIKAGADIISVADTTGYMIPGTKRNMYDYVKNLKQSLTRQGLNPKIEVHCHNDRGFALANAIDAFRAGAEIIDASVLGVGERAGIVDLAQLLTVLKADFKVKNKWNLKKLSELYELVSLHSGVEIPINFPVLGRNAFTHCAGIHTHAAQKNPTHYQSLNPKLVGRQMEVSLDHMSGLSSVIFVLGKLGYKKPDTDLARAVLQKVKQVGRKGKRVDLDELKQIVEWCKGLIS